MTRLTLLAALMLAAGACTPAHRPIPDGVYYADSGVDFIVIDSATLAYFGFLDSLHPDSRRRFPYTYEILPEGRISMTMTSADLFYGMGRYDLSWEDGEIVMTERVAWREVTQDGERVTRLVEIEEARRPTRRFVRVR